METNKITLQDNDYFDVEQIIKKIASDNNVKNITNVEISISSNEGIVKFKTAAPETEVEPTISGASEIKYFSIFWETTSSSNYDSEQWNNYAFLATTNLDETSLEELVHNAIKNTYISVSEITKEEGEQHREFDGWLESPQEVIDIIQANL